MGQVCTGPEISPGRGREVEGEDRTGPPRPLRSCSVVFIQVRQPLHCKRLWECAVREHKALVTDVYTHTLTHSQRESLRGLVHTVSASGRTLALLEGVSPHHLLLLLL